MSEKTQIKISDVLGMLQDGKTRKDIGEHYGLSGTDTKRLFQHPALKGRKTIKTKEVPFVIVDETEEAPIADSPSYHEDLQLGMTGIEEEQEEEQEVE